MVLKEGKKDRMIMDYWSLNKITKLIRYPLSVIEDQIDNLESKEYFISFDLKSGYYQIPMHSDTIKKKKKKKKKLNEALKGTKASVYIDDVLLTVNNIEKKLKKISIGSKDL